MLTSIFILIIILIIVALWIANSFNLFSAPKSKSVTYNRDVIKLFDPPSAWIELKPVEGDEGKCRLYTFRTPAGEDYSRVSYADMSGSSVIITPYTPACYDYDQLFAQKMTHRCGSVTSSSAATYCRKRDGSKAAIGEEETFWRNCGRGLASDSKCPGTLAAISYNYNPSKQVEGAVRPNARCISIISGGDATGNLPCLPGLDETKLKVQRFKYVSRKLVADDNGEVGKIFDRFTGKCLAPTIPNDPKGEKHLKNAVAGPLTFIDCSVDFASGVWWLFQPSTLINPVDPVTDPNGLEHKSPQQIVFIKSLNDLAPIATDKDTFRAYLKLSLSIGTDGKMALFRQGTSTTAGVPGTSLDQDNTIIVDSEVYRYYKSGNRNLYPFF